MLLQSSSTSVRNQQCCHWAKYSGVLCIVWSMHQLHRWIQSPLLLLLPHLFMMILFHAVSSKAIFLVLSWSSGHSIYLTNLQIDNLLTLLLQLLAATMSQLKMGPSTHHSTPMNIPTHKTAAGSSLFPMDMEFISTSPYFRRSLWLITSLSGESGDTHTHLLSSALDCVLERYCITDENLLKALTACLLSAH